MKKSLYISALALMLAGTSLTSCSDFLDADNKTTANKTADDYLIDHPDELLTEAYASVYKFAYEVEMNEDGTDLYIPVRGKSPSAFDQYTLNASTDAVYSYYKNLYTTINNANAVVYYNDMKTKNASYDAEAKFLRCWCYYLLTQQFGDVPYVTTYVKDMSTSFARTPVKEVYDACIKELTAIYTSSDVSLPTVSSHSNKAQPTKEAYAALISKLYLAMAWDCYVTETGSNVDPSKVSAEGKSAFEDAATWANNAINNASLSLTFEDLWSPKNDNNKEVLWAIQSDRTTAIGAHSLQNDYGSYYGEYTGVNYKNVGSLHAQSVKSLYLFAKGDERYEATFMTTIYNKSKDTAKKSGYYSYYADASSRKGLIGYRYFPYYMEQADVEAELKSNKDSYSYSADDGNNTDVKAFILGNLCYTYSFLENGSFVDVVQKPYGEFTTAVASGVCVKKFDDPEGTQKSGDDYRCIPMFTLGDMYLTAAEAFYMANDETSSLEKLNAVRARAKAEDLGSSYSNALSTYSNIYEYSAAEGGFKAIDIILDERAREMYAERTRWIDLRRTKQLERYNKAYNQNLLSSVKTLRPIPTNEMTSNSGITYQNQGY